MGLFSGSKKTYVGTSLIRLVEEADMPNSAKAGIIQALHSDGDLMESITSNLFSSIGAKAEKFYKYGENKFIYGNPTGEFITNQIAFNQVQAIIRRETGDPNIQVLYAKFGPENFWHHISKRMVDDYDYDTKTNKLHGLSLAPDIPAYLHDITHNINLTNMGVFWSVPEGVTGIFDRWEPQWLYQAEGLDNFFEFTPKDQFHRPFQFSYSRRTEVGFDYHLISDEKEGEGFWERPVYFEQKRIIFPLDTIDFHNDYFQVSYLRDGRRYYWSYKHGSGQYPELDNYFENPENFKEFGEFYPSVYFMVNKKFLDEDKDSEEYKSNKKLLKTLGIDYDFVVDAIKESDDLKDIEYSYLTFGVRPDSQDPADQEYLFKFFNKLYEYQEFGAQIPSLSWNSPGSIFSNSYNRDGRVDLPNSINIKDRKFRSVLGNLGIFKRIRVGSVAAVGSYQSENDKHYVTIPGGEDDYGEPIALTVGRTRHTYRYQSGTNVYEEITVYQLEYKYFIWGDLGTLGTDNNENHIIPLERSIVETLPLSKRERLMAGAMHLAFHSRVTIREKWYQSGFFSFVVHVIAFAAFAWGAKALLTGVNALVSAGFINSLQALAIVGKALLGGIAASLAIKLAVQVLGIDVSIVLAVVMAAVSLYQSLGGFDNLPSILSAENLLKTALGLVDAVAESVQDAIKLIGEEYSDFLKEAQEQLKLLDEANDMLRPTSILSPFVYLGESAEDFYNRTIHSGNVGIMAIEAQSHFVDQALQLPTFKDTLGGFSYAL